MLMEQLTDEQLVERCRESSDADRRAAANVLFARHYERVGRWCFRFSGDRETAADMAQEVFAKAYKHLGSFQGTSKFTTWLYAIVRNESLNSIKARSFEPAASDSDVDENLLASSGLEAADTAYEREETARLVRDVINHSLDQTEQAVFTMHYGDDVPLDAITRLLGLSNASGAKAFIVSARRKLARAAIRLRATGVCA